MFSGKFPFKSNINTAKQFYDSNVDYSPSSEGVSVMVYILPINPPQPHLTYIRTYDELLRSRRLAPDSSVIMLVPPELDALCAAHILSTLFARDDVNLRTIPVAGYPSLQSVKRELLGSADQLHHLILLNIGSLLDISGPEWFGEFPSKVTIHIIDSARPFELRNLFGAAGVVAEGEDEPQGPRVVVWDDGHAEKLQEERVAFDADEYGFNSSDEDDESDGDDLSDEGSDIEEDYEEGGDGGRKRRRSASDDGRRRRRRRKTLEGDEENGPKLSREQRERNREVIDNHYNSGTHHGQSAAAIVYTLCTQRNCADNELLWLAVLGLTHQYLSSSITREQYDHYYGIFNDEVARLNPPITTAAKGRGDDNGVRPSIEFRFALLQKWNLYDAMFHSGYVANKLAIWKEEGTKRLKRLLTKMGLSLQQSQQTYTYMDAELRERLPTQLEDIAPESGLLELSYPSFTKSYGNEMPRTSAADVLAGVGALLEAAKGIRLTVQVEGGKGGGELFGAERLWDLRKDSGRPGKENIPVRRAEERRQGDEAGQRNAENGDAAAEGDEDDDGVVIDGQKVWILNFWTAFDALGNNTSLLRQSLPLAISLQRAIVRQGCSILEKRSIKFHPEFRFIKITEGPDLATFAHPSTLTRLTLWLVEATRDRIPKVHAARMSRSNKKSYPFVVACLNERANAYVVVGVTGALEMGEVRKNHFGVAFLEAKERSNARTRHSTFDTSVIEVNVEDLPAFVDALDDLYRPIKRLRGVKTPSPPEEAGYEAMILVTNIDDSLEVETDPGSLFSQISSLLRDDLRRLAPESCLNVALLEKVAAKSEKSREAQNADFEWFAYGGDDEERCVAEASEEVLSDIESKHRHPMVLIREYGNTYDDQ
ncbi:hypothetical protein FRB99_004754 [Tulasnella sp. 403]|nr:hypothetical protein FRB99_004754 [Tulasnella sp. 403]